MLLKFWAAIKLLVAIFLSPLIIATFFISKRVFLFLMTELWPHLDILSLDGKLYLRRFFMTPKTRWYRPRFLHYIVQSDTGRDPHDHPGEFTTTILDVGYIEQIFYPQGHAMDFYPRPSDWEVRRVTTGMTVHNPRRHTHRVTLFGPTWTWVVAWIKGVPWGFWKLDPMDSAMDRWVESEAYGDKGVEVKSWEHFP